MQTVLRMARAVSNFLNAGTSRGGMMGLKIVSLVKLASTKSPVNRKLSLLHFLVERCAAHPKDTGLFLHTHREKTQTHAHAHEHACMQT